MGDWCHDCKSLPSLQATPYTLGLKNTVAGALTNEAHIAPRVFNLQALCNMSLDITCILTCFV